MSKQRNRFVYPPSPIDGSVYEPPDYVYPTKEGETEHGYVPTIPAEIDFIGAEAHRAFLAWRTVPAPKRGELVRRYGSALRLRQDDLAELITAETGKILAESRGEVQEMIDICDFAVGLSRQLHGLTIASERPDHRMMEQWLPLGPVLVISAFNFPAAVWAWNAMLAIVCGDAVIWKPSEKTPHVTRFCADMFRRNCENSDDIATPKGLLQEAYGGVSVARRLIKLPQVRLVSATGSCAMGRAVAKLAAPELGKRTLLELGGNNAMIVAPSADLDLAVRAIVFSAVGTAGQRCTTLRRLIVHESVHRDVVRRLTKAYCSIVVGNPQDMQTLVGPLIDATAAKRMDAALVSARAQGGRIVCGGQSVRPRSTRRIKGGSYRRPALVLMPSQTAIVREETFAPILYVMKYRTLEQAIEMQNDVPQGLSSSIFTRDMQEAEQFLSAVGSDCGIANVNIGTSGAEIGGAFGGEKDTGGGRESGSDAWKAYMRRATNTINYGRSLPLAQGIDFGGK
jgi:aldehyde dehydrogenase (NAD+)